MAKMTNLVSLFHLHDVCWRYSECYRNSTFIQSGVSIHLHWIQFHKCLLYRVSPTLVGCHLSGTMLCYVSWVFYSLFAYINWVIRSKFIRAQLSISKLYKHTWIVNYALLVYYIWRRSCGIRPVFNTKDSLSNVYKHLFVVE